MIPKGQRLSRSDFLKRPGRSAPFPFGSVRLLDVPKAAVVVSKRISSSAVVRNRLRRRVYAILRPLLLRGLRGAVVFPNKKALAAAHAELATALEKALER